MNDYQSNTIKAKYQYLSASQMQKLQIWVIFQPQQENLYNFYTEVLKSKIKLFLKHQ